MSRALRSACLFVFVSAMAVLSMPGCSQQGQGERCDSINGDTDCNDGLTCVLSSQLAVRGVDRCCPAPNTETDSRCQRLGGSGNVAGSGGTGGSSGSSGSGGASAAGETSGGMSSLPETGGAAGAPDAAPGGSSNSSAGMPASATAGAANATAGAGGAP